MDTLFFDLDGTLIDIRERYYRVYADCLKHFGGSPITGLDYWTLKREDTPEEEILSITGNKDVFPEYRLERRVRLEAKEYLEFDSIWPNINFCLQNLKVRYNLELVTIRKNHINLEWQLKRFGLNTYFSHIISSQTVQNNQKRGTLKMQMIVNELGNGPFSGWFIGDTEIDIIAGKSLNLGTCVVSFGMRSENYLSTLEPDIQLNSIRDFEKWLKHISKVNITAGKISNIPGSLENPCVH
jgi:phosphoglycolate phosphatase-like HAD superfamily hydrolase